MPLARILKKSENTRVTSQSSRQYPFLIWLGLIVVLLSTPSSLHAEGELAGDYVEPAINRRLFSQGLSMLGSERNDYANNLTAYAVNNLLRKKANQESLDLARQVIGLALHLSPRNKKALIANAQLRRNVMPKAVVADYDSTVFAKLLMTRSVLLEKQPGKHNAKVARYLIDLAAKIDPRNEDATYEAELRRIDHGEPDWPLVSKALTSKQKPATAGASQ